MLLLMFCMSLFHTQTGVPIAGECSVQCTHVCTILIRGYVAINVQYVTLPYANRCAHCRRVQCVPSDWTSCVRAAKLRCKSEREAPRLIEVAAPPQNAETFGNSTSLRSHPGSTLLKSQFYLFIVYRQSSCPHLHYGSISSSFCSPRPDCFITGWAFSSSLFHWIVSLDNRFSLTTISFLQSRQPPPFDLPQLSPHWLVNKSFKLIPCWLSISWLMWLEYYYTISSILSFQADGRCFHCQICQIDSM